MLSKDSPVYIPKLKSADEIIYAHTIDIRYNTQQLKRAALVNIRKKFVIYAMLRPWDWKLNKKDSFFKEQNRSVNLCDFGCTLCSARPLSFSTLLRALQCLLACMQCVPSSLSKRNMFITISGGLPSMDMAPGYISKKFI